MVYFFFSRAMRRTDTLACPLAECRESENCGAIRTASNEEREERTMKVRIADQFEPRAMRREKRERWKVRIAEQFEPRAMRRLL